MIRSSAQEAPSAQTLQPWIIAGAIGATAFLGVRASERVVLWALAAGCVVLFLRWPSLGPLALIGASFLVPFSILTGTETSINASVILVALLLALWLVRIAARREAELYPSRTVPPLLAFAAVVVVASVAGLQPWVLFARTAPLTAQVGGLAVFLLSIGAFLVVAHQIRDLRGLQWLSWLFVVLAALHLLGRLVPEVGGLIEGFVQPSVDGSLLWTWFVALALSQASFNRSLAGWLRFALAALALTTFYMDASQSPDWVSGWLPTAAVVLAMLVAAAPRAVPLVIAAGLAVAAGLSSQVALGAILAGDNAYSLMTRVEAWRILVEIIKANPLLGFGPANYYWYTPLFPILGWNVNFSSHNNYVDIVAQTGLLGLACFLWFVFAAGRLAWTLRNRVEHGFARAYVYGAIGGLAGMLVSAALGDWVLPFVYNVGLEGFRSSVLGWVFLGGLVVVERLTREAPGGVVHELSS